LYNSIIVLINHNQGSLLTSPSNELSYIDLDIHEFVIIKKGEIVELKWVL